MLNDRQQLQDHLTSLLKRTTQTADEGGPVRVSDILSKRRSDGPVAFGSFLAAIPEQPINLLDTDHVFGNERRHASRRGFHVSVEEIHVPTWTEQRQDAAPAEPAAPAIASRFAEITTLAI